MENQFNVGDLVWAKVHPHPWWPSLICHEALASTEAQQAKKEGCMLVSFFGDNSYKWLDPKKLIHFESNYGAYSNRFSSRLFLKAVNEAVYEVNHRAALGLTCPCQFFSSYRPARVEGLLEVDIAGYKSGGIYTVEQIQQFRQGFRPVETVLFVQQLALGYTDAPQDFNYSKEVARVLAFRKTKYAEVDEPYFLAFGVNPRRHGDSVVVSTKQEMALIEAPAGRPSNPAIKCRKKRRCLPTEKDKKAKSSVKKYRRHDSNSNVLEDCVLEKKRLGKFEAERRPDFTTVTDNKAEGFSARTGHLSKPESQGEENPTIEGQNKSKRCLTTQKDNPHATKAKSSVKRDRCHDSNSKISQDHVPDKKSDDVHFVEKAKSFATSVPSKTHGANKDVPASQPFKKRHQSVSPVEGWKMPSTLSNSAIVKPPEQGPRTVLSVKFPRDTALPSASELKAKFARFGPIDASGIRVSWAKSTCQVVFMNKSDAEKAYEHAVGFKEMFGQTKVTYRLYHKVSTSAANIGTDLRQEETPITPPHAPVLSGSTCAYRIERQAEEIYATYREQADQNPVKVYQGCVDISEKMLRLLNECNQIVLQLRRL